MRALAIQTIRATLALNKGDAKQALNILQTGLVRCSQLLAAQSPHIQKLLRRLWFRLAQADVDPQYWTVDIYSEILIPRLRQIGI